MSKGYGKLQLAIIEVLKVGDEATLWTDTYSITNLLSITRQAAHRALKRLVLDGVVIHRYTVDDPIMGEGLPRRVNSYLLAELQTENDQIESDYRQARQDSERDDLEGAAALGVDVMQYKVSQLFGVNSTKNN
jgi:hypothetical protein